MKKLQTFFYISVFSLFTASQAFSLDYTDAATGLSDLFRSLTGSNEGTTSFRSLLIPMGGRPESFGGAYTAVSDDVSYIDYNPAASSLIEQSEIALFHNSWIADSNMETIAATSRFGHLGLGGKISCFYVPFSEYDSFGTKTSASYYSETCAALNIAYHILPGYTFKGIAVGANLKGAWRAVPDYTDDDTGAVIKDSGLEQSALAFMADAGIMLQFNMAKFYNAREANVKVGLSASNLGVALTGFTDTIKKDAPLPTTFGLGFSYKPFRPLTFAFEFRQPVNLFELGEYQMFYAGLGSEICITNFFSVIAGFQLKGANPRFSLGGEAKVSVFKINANYTLDLTTSINPVNRISVSAKALLGDKGRKAKEDEVYRLYNEGIYYFAQKDYERATEKWKQALAIDRYFDPAARGIKITEKYERMLEEYDGISNARASEN